MCLIPYPAVVTSQPAQVAQPAAEAGRRSAGQEGTTGTLQEVIRHGLLVVCYITLRDRAADLWLQVPVALGGWGGIDHAAICDQIAGTGARAFWDNNPVQCAELIDRRLHGYQSVMEAVFALYVVLVATTPIAALAASLYNRQ